MTGAVSPGSVIALHRTITAAADAGHRAIVVDLSAVTFLGAQTAGLFCGALRLLERRGVTLEVRGGPPHLQRMLGRGAPEPTTHDPQRRPVRALELNADLPAADPPLDTAA